MDSALVDALTPDWRAGDAGADARTLATLAADTADDLAAAAADAERRRRRKYRDDESSRDDESDEFASARDASHAPPLLPLALASHPSARVREAAAAALGERMAAVPSRAPATLPPLLLAVTSASIAETKTTRGGWPRWTRLGRCWRPSARPPRVRRIPSARPSRFARSPRS